MPGSFKLALTAAKLLQAHGPKLLHGSDVDLLTKDLGDALRRQKKLIQDPDLNALETAADVGPVIAEVKVLTLALSKKLDIDTKGKSTIAVLEEIVQKTEDRNSDSAAEIKNTLDWTRHFFSHPKTQDILNSDMAGIELPQSVTDLKGIGKIFTQSAVRATQEVSRVKDFLEAAKEVGDVPPPKKPRAAPAKKPAARRTKKSGPKPK